MIRHILKKDLALLWPLTGALAVLQVVVELARYQLVVRGANWGALQLLDVLVAVVSVVLIVLLVHQDALPGVRQDWLTRPIKRIDLLIAKVSFLLVLIHGPRFAANTVDVLAAGFPLPQALGAAAASGFSLLVTTTLVAFAIAVVTRTMTEFVIAGIVVAFVDQAASSLFYVFSSIGCGATCETSIEWIPQLAQTGLTTVAALAVIALQYFRRDATAWARVAVVVTAVFVVGLWHMPWGVAFALQQAATGATEGQDRITLELDSAPTPPLAPPARERAMISAARSSLAGDEVGTAELRARRRAESSDTLVSIPLRVSGLRPGEVAWTDRVVFRLATSDGRVFSGTGDELEIRADDGVAHSVQQALSVPAHIFDKYRDSELRLELDYWITSLETTATLSLPVMGGEAALAGAKCSTGLRGNGAVVRFLCVTIDRPPPCYTAAVESRSTSTRNPDVLICEPDYAPYRNGSGLFKPFAITLPLTDPGAAADSVVRVAAYSPRAHSTSRLVVPRARLADWAVPQPE